MAKLKEHINYAEIATFHHVNDNEQFVETLASVNQPIRPSQNSKTVNQVGKVRVEMHVTEDTTAQGNQSYRKDLWNEQIRDGGSQVSTPIGNKQYQSTPNKQRQDDDNDDVLPRGVDNNTNDLPAWGKVLKNFVDKIADDNKMQWVVIAIIGICVGIAIGLAVI